MEEVTLEQIKQVVDEAIDELRAHHQWVLQNDVNERTITGQLGDYIQQRIPNLSVDCEYNKDVTRGEGYSKTVTIDGRER